MLSRGLNPRELISATAWWNGPTFLQQNDKYWPGNEFLRLHDEASEFRRNCAIVDVTNCNIVDELLNKRSDINKVYRILVYCLRFLKHSNIVHIARGSISSLKFDVKIVQQYSFPEEHKALGEGKSVSSTSKIVLLNPYIHGQRRTD